MFQNKNNFFFVHESLLATFTGELHLAAVNNHPILQFWHKSYQKSCNWAESRNPTERHKPINQSPKSIQIVEFTYFSDSILIRNKTGTCVFLIYLFF